SLIIQPVGGANAVAPQGTLRLATAASPSMASTDALPPTFPAAANPLTVGQTNVLAAPPAAVAPKIAGAEPVVLPADTGVRHEPATAHDQIGARHSGGLVNGIDGDLLP